MEVTKHIQRVRENPCYIGKPWNETKIAKEGLTERVGYCIAGGLTRLKSGVVTFFHHIPAQFNNFDSVKKELLEKSSQIKQSKEPLSGLLIGGHFSHRDPQSEKLALKIEEQFKSMGVNFSKFLGQKGDQFGSSNIYYNPSENTWYVNYAILVADRIKDVKNPVTFLKSVYEQIKIHKSDDVFVNDLKVNKKLLHRSMNFVPLSQKYEYLTKK
jgi:hypothetical protein